MSEIEVVRGALRHVAKTLDRELRPLTSGEGAQNDLDAQGAVTAEHLGNWDAGRALEVTAMQAHNAIGRGYAEFVRDCQTLIAGLLKVADNYDGAEEEIAKQIKGILGVVGE